MFVQTLGQGVSLIGGAVSRLAGQQVPTSSVGQNNAHEASHGHVSLAKALRAKFSQKWPVSSLIFTFFLNLAGPP